jgi:predicted DNA-binding antitoxin AbrB/MazE fold protein
MKWTVEAIFEGGVLRPLAPLPFQNQQRVRLTIESEALGTSDVPSTGAKPTPEGRQRLIRRLGEAGYKFSGPPPAREELYER